MSRDFRVELFSIPASFLKIRYTKRRYCIVDAETNAVLDDSQNNISHQSLVPLENYKTEDYTNAYNIGQ